MTAYPVPCTDGGCDCSVAAPDELSVDLDDPVVLVHRDAGGDPVYWTGYANGPDSAGWTADRTEALTFETFAAANLERNFAKRWHPTMKIELERVP